MNELRIDFAFGSFAQYEKVNLTEIRRKGRLIALEDKGEATMHIQLNTNAVNIRY